MGGGGGGGGAAIPPLPPPISYSPRSSPSALLRGDSSGTPGVQILTGCPPNNGVKTPGLPAPAATKLTILGDCETEREMEIEYDFEFRVGERENVKKKRNRDRIYMQIKCSLLLFAVVVVVVVIAGVDNQADVVVVIGVDVVDMAGGTAPYNVIALKKGRERERGDGGERERERKEELGERDDVAGGI